MIFLCILVQLGFKASLEHLVVASELLIPHSLFDVFDFITHRLTDILDISVVMGRQYQLEPYLLFRNLSFT